jgi:hypothetical protein
VLAKISKIARFILLMLIFSIGLLYIVFKSQPVQTWLVQKATVYLSNEMGTKIKVGAVDIDFFKTAVLQNVYIEDQHQDTLFYFRNLKLDYNSYDKIHKKININSLTIYGGKILIGQHKGDTVGNYEFLIDYFDGGPRDPNKPKVVWTIFSKKLTLFNTRFDYFSRNDPKPDFMDFDYNDMSYRDINGSVEDFYLIDDSLHFQIKHLQTHEKCGLKVLDFVADTKIHEGGISFDKMTLTTENSLLKNYFEMVTKDWKDYNDFNHKVYLKGVMNDSKIDSKDLHYFSNYLKQYTTPITITGRAEGFVSKLKAKDTYIKLFDQTEYEGNFNITGLPNIDDALMEFNVKKFVTDYKDLNAISLNNIPDNFKQLGKIIYEGQFDGFFNDFVTYGKLQTALGNFESDLNLKFKNGLDNATYSGKLKTDLFKIKAFLPEANIDDIAFDLKMKGIGLNPKTYKLNLEGFVNQVRFNNYLYKNIEANGELEPTLFSGIAKIRDPHLNLDFDGNFNTKGKVPEANFNAKIVNADLGALGFDTSEQNIKGTFVINFKGKTLDDAIGTIVGNNVSIYRNNQTVNISEIMLSSTYLDNRKKELKIVSEIVDASIVGDYTLSKLDISLLHLMHQLIPIYFNKPIQDLPNEDFDFTVNLKNPDALTDLYQPKLSLAPFKANGKYKSGNQSLSLYAQNEKVVYDGFEINNLTIKAFKKPLGLLNIEVKATDFTNKKSINSEDIIINADIYDNIIDFNLNGLDTGYHIGVKSIGKMIFGKDSIDIRLAKTNIEIDNELWYLDTSAAILLTDNKYEIFNFNLRNENQSISFNGEYGEKSNSTFKLDVNAFSLNTINRIIKDGKLPILNGISNGQVSYSLVQNKPIFKANFNVENLAIGNDTVGNLEVGMNKYNKALDNQDSLRIRVLGGVLNKLDVSGTIDFKSKTDNFKLDGVLPPSDISILQPFLEGVVSKMKGKMSSNELRLRGGFDNPDLKGYIDITDASMIVDYLNIPISFSTRVKAEKNKLDIGNFKVRDDKGKFGNVSGFVNHTNFDNFKMDLSITELQDFHVLNTDASDNELYYGQAYMNGNVTFKGPFDNLDIDINAQTMNGTSFYLPISDGDASGFPSYVHFKTGKKRTKRKNDFPINSLKMDVEATPDANIQIIFDETLGDIISGNGRGNIKMEMTKSGDFYMFGNYTIEQGKYLFTAFDLYNKPFAVKPGGTIKWFGDPLDAKLNITAYTTEKATSEPLLTAVASVSSTTQTNPIITAESELYIKGNLFSPEITFGLNFPKLQTEAGNSSNAISSVITRIKADKEEVSRQVFGLLIMKQFLPPSFAQSSQGINNVGSTALNSAGSDLLSSQLSNWLNKIDPYWKVNVIYRNGSYTLPAEYGIGLSRKFFNEKLSFDGSISNYSSNRPNINIEYKVTKKGNLRVKAYTRSNINQVNTTSLNTPINTTGVGIVYTKEFNTFFRLFRKKKKKKEIVPVVPSAAPAAANPS